MVIDKAILITYPQRTVTFWNEGGSGMVGSRL